MKLRDKIERLLDSGWERVGDGFVLDVSDSIMHVVRYVTFGEGTLEENVNAAWHYQVEREARGVTV